MKNVKTNKQNQTKVVVSASIFFFFAVADAVAVGYVFHFLAAIHCLHLAAVYLSKIHSISYRAKVSIHNALRNREVVHSFLSRRRRRRCCRCCYVRARQNAF